MQIERITDSVHMVTGTNVNWAFVTDGHAVTVVDAGYPNDGAALLASLRAIGHRPEDVIAILLTHAHLDHMGGIPTLLAAHRAPVFTGKQEMKHARREYLEQVSIGAMLGECRRVAGARWVAHTVRAVLPHASMKLEDDDLAAALPGARLDAPGGPVAVETPGHTSGHTVWHLPDDGVVFTGDALVTAHPLSRGGTRPQLLPSLFNEDETEMKRSLRALAQLPADVIVPGHGPS